MIVSLRAECVLFHRSDAVVAGLFTLIGGSLIAFFDKTTAQAQRAAVIALFGLSVGSLVGVYTGIIVNEHMVLSPKGAATTRSGVLAASAPVKYLRENTLLLIDEIDAKHRTGVLTAEQAYAELFKAVKE